MSIVDNRKKYIRSTLEDRRFWCDARHLIALTVKYKAYHILVTLQTQPIFMLLSKKLGFQVHVRDRRNRRNCNEILILNVWVTNRLKMVHEHRQMCIKLGKDHHYLHELQTEYAVMEASKKSILTVKYKGVLMV